MYEGSLHTWSTSSSRFNDVCKVTSSDAAAANLPATLELRFIKAEDALQPRPGASAPELQLELRSSDTTDRLVRQKLDQLANFLGKRKMARMVLGNGDELLVTAIVAREGHHGHHDLDAHVAAALRRRSSQRRDPLRSSAGRAARRLRSCVLRAEPEQPAESDRPHAVEQPP